MKLIGIGGTDGSGKDLLGEILARDHGWKFISVTNFLREELKKRKLPVTRPNQRMLSAEWRRQHGLAVLVDKAIEDFNKESKSNDFSGLVLASLRNPGEADHIHQHKGIVVWLDADPRIRYGRITVRNRGGIEDRVTFDEFLAEEKAQSAHQGDEATLNLSGVKAKADVTIMNNGDDIEEFKANAEAALLAAKVL